MAIEKKHFTHFTTRAYPFRDFKEIFGLSGQFHTVKTRPEGIPSGSRVMGV